MPLENNSNGGRIETNVVCVARSGEDIEKGFELLDERKVQLLYARFPVGKGTFKRNKFISVMFIGPECGNVKRGRCLTYMSSFRDKLKGSAGITVTEKSSLSLHHLVERMRTVFVSDLGNFSIAQIIKEYQQRIQEQEGSFYFSFPPHHGSVELSSVSRGSRGSVDMEYGDGDDGMTSTDSLMMEHSVPFSTCVVSETVERVLNAVRNRLGSLNWVTFAANPVELCLRNAGNGGVYELVRNLPHTLWLFGLFRITLCVKGHRMTRVVSFQWIGDQLGAVPRDSYSKVSPIIESILSPFQHEVYLVGAQDLNPNDIIERCYRAFEYQMQEETLEPVDFSNYGDFINCSALQETKKELRHVGNDATTPEKHLKAKLGVMYRIILEEERDKMDQPLVFTRVGKVREGKLRIREITGNSATTLKHEEGAYDAEETLKLINRNEGGLIWGIFEVR